MIEKVESVEDSHEFSDDDEKFNGANPIKLNRIRSRANRGQVTKKLSNKATQESSKNL